MGEHRKPRNPETDPNWNHHRSKITTISSILVSSESSSSSSQKKKLTLRGLGCKASPQVSVPAVIRTSANWESPPSSSSSSSKKLMKKRLKSSSCVGVPDIWCAPPLTTDVLSTRLPRSKILVPRDREREIVMLQSSLLRGRRSDGLDRYRDLRLDVDNMSYEELLELGDRIGYVNTGLGEDEINQCLRRTKLVTLDGLSLCYASDTERKCSICQEDYERDDETGKLNCGHFYHLYCIKQWLGQKNSCPICKTSAAE